MINEQITASIAVIGNEILSGRTQDQNVSIIAERLSSVGIVLSEVRIIPDIKGNIVEAIRALSASHKYVFTTGGIGPTHDDITSAAIAEAFGCNYALHPQAYAVISDYYTSLGREVSQASKKMAYMPEGVKILDNPISGAPGFTISNVYVLPGIPHIMQAMLELVLPNLQHGPAIRSKNLDLLVGESVIAAKLEVLQNEYPQIDIGSYPFTVNGVHATSVVMTSSYHVLLDAAYCKLTNALLEYHKID